MGIRHEPIPEDGDGCNSLISDHDALSLHDVRAPPRSVMSKTIAPVGGRPSSIAPFTMCCTLRAPRSPLAVEPVHPAYDNEHLLAVTGV